MDEALTSKSILVAFDLDDTLYKEQDFIQNGYCITLDRFTLNTLQSLKEQGYRIAIITDGEAKVQREKINIHWFLLQLKKKRKRQLLN